jgi:hypothetical protein
MQDSKPGGKKKETVFFVNNYSLKRYCRMAVENMPTIIVTFVGRALRG